MKILLRFFGFLFAAGTIVFLAGIAAVAGLLWHYSKDLPDYSQLQNYEPPVMTRVHAADGSLLAEYANERRLYLPIQAIPKLVTNAFIAAEDKNFYQPSRHRHFRHRPRRAALRPELRQQPPAAGRLDHHPAGGEELPPDQRAFGHPQDQGSAARAAHRARLFQGPDPRTLSQPDLSRSRRLRRRGRFAPLFRQVGARTDDRGGRLSRRAAQGAEQLQSVPPPRRGDRAAQLRASTAWSRTATSPAEAGDKAKKEPLTVAVRPTGAHTFAAEYFAEEVRRYIFENYGEKKLYEGGLSVRTTLDPKMQVLARKTMTDGLVNFDETQGWRGPVSKIDISGDWGVKLADLEVAVRHRSVAACGGARGQRPVGAYRLAAGARSGRRGGQGTRDRHHAARRRQMGEAGEPDRSGKADPARQPGAFARRRGLCRAAQASRASSACARCRRFPAPWW